MRQELRGLEGVIGAEVSYDEAVATVRYLPEATSPTQMKETIDATGFGAEVIQEHPRDAAGHPGESR